MVNFKNVLMLASSALVLGACSNASTDATDNTNSTENALVEESSSTQAVQQEEVVKSTSDKGNRSNPAKFGEVATANFSYYDENGTYDAQLDLVLSNPIRGEEAYNILVAENQFNEPAPEGYEWIIFDVAGTLVKGDQDAPLAQIIEVSSVSASGVQSSPDFYATYTNKYGEAELYQGGTATGRLATIVPTSEAFTIQIGIQFESDTFFTIE